MRNNDDNNYDAAGAMSEKERKKEREGWCMYSSHECIKICEDST